MTFKTAFGTVEVRRRRIKHKADDSTEVPSASAWETPQQVTITQGLRDATCDAMLRESSRKSLRELEEHAREPGLLSRVTVLNIVRSEGRQLRAAAKRRAHAVFLTDPEARRHFCEKDARSIIYLVGAVLATRGVHQGKLALLFVNDGARWIRDWFEGLNVPSKTMVLCWYHLAKRCLSDLGQACSGRKHRDQMCPEVLRHLWEGRVDDALAFLAEHRKDKEIRSRPALDQFVEYLNNRRPYLPNYSQRRQAGVWIASNRVEKLNDWAVSQRCKGLGMDWTREGILGLAVLEATRRNDELTIWRSNRTLPALSMAPAESTAA